MIRLFECTDATKVGELLGRRSENLNVDAEVAKILANVKSVGDQALLEYTRRFDGVCLEQLEVSEKEIEEATKNVGQEFLDVLCEAKGNITEFHMRQKREGFTISDKPGIILGQKVTPLDRIGIYVPGGTASYPSTVLMAAIPAKIAGVREIIMVSPPNKKGEINPDVLAAAKIAGVDRIFKVGGAQAVAALSYGTATVPRVDKIVGPGNIYVAVAKRMVFGQVDIDMIAGPSEVLIIADEGADENYVAIDLLSQAEHDKLAAAMLVTTDRKLAEKVQLKIEEYLKDLPRNEIASRSITDNGAIIVTDTLSRAVEISNEIAPEHLEICTQNPFELLDEVKNAGSIFLGKYSPEALGDYMAGTNHTLPTSGTAKFSSPLSVDDYVKKSSFVSYDRKALQGIYQKIALFAQREGLDAHARSVLVRFEDCEGCK